MCHDLRQISVKSRSSFGEETYRQADILRGTASYYAIRAQNT